MLNTGDGLKTLDAVADRVGPAATIDPSLRRVPRRRPRLSPATAQSPHRGAPSIMSVTVRIPTILRTYTGGESEVVGRGRDPRPRSSTTWSSNYPGISGRILDDQGELRRFVNVYVGDDDVRFVAGPGDGDAGRRGRLDHPGRRRRADPDGPDAIMTVGNGRHRAFTGIAPSAREAEGAILAWLSAVQLGNPLRLRMPDRI